MSTFRKIYTKFWKDGKVIEELTPEAKFFFIYLLTNPATTQIGIYQITIKNWGRYNLDRGGKPMRDCIKKELEMVSDISLIEYISENIKREDIKEVFVNYINKIKNLNNDTCNDTHHDTLGSSGQVKVKEEVKDKIKEEDKDKDIKSSNVGKYVKLYEENIGLINKISYEWIKDISEEIDIKLFKKAIEIATDKGKCNKGYIGGII